MNDKTEKLLSDMESYLVKVGVPAPRLIAEQISVRLFKDLGENISSVEMLERINQATLFWLELRDSLSKELPILKLPINLVNELWRNCIETEHGKDISLEALQVRARHGR